MYLSATPMPTLVNPHPTVNTVFPGFAIMDKGKNAWYCCLGPVHVHC